MVAYTRIYIVHSGKIIGGSIGALLGMHIFHHKTLHKKFTIGIPAILVLQIILASWIILRLKTSNII